MGLLRLWLALCVASTHSGPFWNYRFMKGGDAVAAFFILAGFFAAFMIDTRYRGRYRVFYLNRLLRVWPLYLLALLATAALLALGAVRANIAIGPLQALPHLQAFPSHGWIGAWSLSQFFLAGQDLWNFAFVTGTGAVVLACSQPGALLLGNLALLPQAWTLALEEYFYLLAPWLEKLGLAASGVVLAAWLLAYRPLEAACDRLPLHFFPVAAALFIGGIFSYRCYQRWQRRAAWLTRLRPWISGAYFGFVLGAAYHGASQPVTVLATVLALPFLFDAFRDRPWDRFVGDLSYPVYLWHVTLQWALWWLWPAAAAQAPAVMGLVLLWALLLALLIEAPLRRYRARLAEK
jgi:peptidoglycan/LPS O-acetylase OafA/YrhL